MWLCSVCQVDALWFMVALKPPNWGVADKRHKTDDSFNPEFWAEYVKWRKSWSVCLYPTHSARVPCPCPSLRDLLQITFFSSYFCNYKRDDLQLLQIGKRGLKIGMSFLLGMGWAA